MAVAKFAIDTPSYICEFEFHNFDIVKNILDKFQENIVPGHQYTSHM